MPDFAPITSQDRITVRDAHNNSRKALARDVLPKVRVYPQDSKKKITGYKLSDLKDGIVQEQLPRWRRGQRRPNPRGPGEASVTLNELEGYSTEPDGKTKDTSFDDRFRYFNNQAERHLAECDDQIEMRIASVMTSTTYFNQESFSSGTGALDTMNADHQPDVDINNNLRENGIRDYESRIPGLKLVCVLDKECARVLAPYEVYSGRGTASLLPRTMPYAELAAAMMEVHGFKDIVVLERFYDANVEGEALSQTRIFDGVMWIGLVSEQMEFDLTMEDGEGPDGSIALSMTYEPDVDSWTDDEAKFEYFAADTEFAVQTPRFSSDTLKLGDFYPAAQFFTNP